MTAKKLRLNLAIQWDGERWVCGDDRTGLYGMGKTEEEAIGDYFLSALQYRELATKDRPLVVEQEQLK